MQFAEESTMKAVGMAVAKALMTDMMMMVPEEVVVQHL